MSFFRIKNKLILEFDNEHETDKPKCFTFLKKNISEHWLSVFIHLFRMVSH